MQVVTWGYPTEISPTQLFQADGVLCAGASSMATSITACHSRGPAASETRWLAYPMFSFTFSTNPLSENGFARKS